MGLRDHGRIVTEFLRMCRYKRPQIISQWLVWVFFSSITGRWTRAETSFFGISGQIVFPLATHREWPIRKKVSALETDARPLEWLFHSKIGATWTFFDQQRNASTLWRGFSFRCFERKRKLGDAFLESGSHWNIRHLIRFGRYTEMKPRNWREANESSAPKESDENVIVARNGRDINKKKHDRRGCPTKSIHK